MAAYREAFLVSEVPLIPASVVLLACLAAAAMDLWRFKIYNVLTVPLLVSGVAYHGTLGGLHGLQASLMGILFGFAVLIVVYAMGGIGAGDVKLMAAIGAWLCMPLTFYVFVLGALASGLYAAVLVLSKGSLRETWIELQVVLFRIMAFGQFLGADSRLEDEVMHPDRRRRLVPFGAMLAVGLVLLLLWIKYTDMQIEQAGSLARR
jgi:prepilin peptidase CpaA